MNNSIYSDFDTVIIRENQEGEEIELTVRAFYNHYTGSHGARDSICGIRNAGPALEPDEPPEIEIVKAMDLETKQIIDLTNSEEKNIIQEIWDNQENF
jgi:hypothetical protein